MQSLSGILEIILKCLREKLPCEIILEYNFMIGMTLWAGGLHEDHLVSSYDILTILTIFGPWLKDLEVW